MTTGELRIYLGAAPGVGKTYALLDEGERRAGRGTDVVIAALDTRNRPATMARAAALQASVARPMDLSVDGALDVDAVLARHPTVALVDELAARNPPGRRHEHRWQDVAELLEAGIDVITTLDIGELESLASVVADIVGRGPGDVVPDRIVRSASQIHLVDQTPEALRRRLAHGNIVGADDLPADLAEAFSEEKLAALRELTLGWMVDRAEEDRDRRRAQHRDAAHRESGGWETREVVVVAVTGALSAAPVIARAARIADRQRGRLVGVHVRSVDPLTATTATDGLEEQRRLLRSFGGTYQEVASGDVGAALVKVAQLEGATQIVIGSSGRSRWVELTRGSLVSELVEQSPIDVHVVATEVGERRSLRRRIARRPSVFSPRRTIWAWVVAIVAPLVAALILSAVDRSVPVSAQLLIMLLSVVAAAVSGGWRPAVLAGVEAFVLSNWYFVAPVHALSIADSEDVVSLVAFLVVALTVGGYVSVATRRSVDALRARSDASTLAAMAGEVATRSDPVAALVARLRDTFGATGASLLLHDAGEWVVAASDGPESPVDDDHAASTLPVGDHGRLLLAGSALRSIDDETTAAFLDQLAVATEQQRLRTSEHEAALAAPANELRAALLNAVSHDLRTPLASVKAAVSTLRQPDVEWPPEIRAEFLATIEAGADRLSSLIVNLLDMSRIQAGAVELRMETVRLDEIVLRSVIGMQPPPDESGAVRAEIDVDIDESLPGVLADPALLQHVVTNIVDNALKWSPPGARVRIDAAVIAAGESARRIVLRIIDQGPGIPRSQRDAVLQPFQRRGDTAAVEGTGLGLAVASGFAHLMGLGLRIDDTPGGGTTVVLELPVAAGSADS